MHALRTLPTAASPSSTSFTLLLGLGAAFAESAISVAMQYAELSHSARAVHEVAFGPMTNPSAILEYLQATGPWICRFTEGRKIAGYQIL